MKKILTALTLLLSLASAHTTTLDNFNVLYNSNNNTCTKTDEDLKVALKMAEILVEKYGFPPYCIADIKDEILNKPYLFVYLAPLKKITTSQIPKGREDYFINHRNKEIDINVFIRTNGTMKPPKLLKQKVIKWKRF